MNEQERLKEQIRLRQHQRRNARNDDNNIQEQLKQDYLQYTKRERERQMRELQNSQEIQQFLANQIKEKKEKDENQLTDRERLMNKQILDEIQNNPQIYEDIQEYMGKTGKYFINLSVVLI